MMKRGASGVFCEARLLSHEGFLCDAREEGIRSGSCLLFGRSPRGRASVFSLIGVQN